MKPLTATDWAILDFLSRDPTRVRPLLRTHPKQTVYRRLDELRAAGLISKAKAQYALTAAGEQVKLDRETTTYADGLAEVYPPLREVPTPQHRAVLELALAALVSRRHTDRDDRHAGFLLIGPTLTWKSSAGRFLCLAAGVDPSKHIVDLATESGKSLWVRRGPTGDIVGRRALLKARVAIFDEFQLADRAVRRAIAPFLSGRRRVPVENRMLPIAPVSVVTMNPAAGPTLTARTGFSVPQLRRLIVCDVSGLDLSDLALRGERAIDAARRAGPVQTHAPRASCEGFRTAVVQGLRHTLRPEALGVVDVELLIGLGTAMTAWLPATVAMRRVLFDFLLVAETVGWVKEGWVADLGQFPGAPGRVERERQSAPPITAEPTPAAVADPKISLVAVRRAAGQPQEARAMSAGRESIMPSFTMSDETKARLIWLSQETGVSVDEAVQTLVSTYHDWELEGCTFSDVKTILQLCKQCEAADISVWELQRFLEQTATLKKLGIRLEDVGTAVQVADALAAEGLTLEHARAVDALMTTLDDAGIDPTVPDELRTALDRYQALGYAPELITRLAALNATLQHLGLTADDLHPQLEHLSRLKTLGLDAATAETLATALDSAGVRGDGRTEVLKRLVDTACAEIDFGKALARLKAARADQAALEANCAKLRETSLTTRAQVAGLLDQKRQLERDLAALREESAKLQDAVAAANALENFLLGNLPLSDPFWIRLIRLAELKVKCPGRFPGIEKTLTFELQLSILAFFMRVVQPLLSMVQEAQQHALPS